MPDSRLRVWHIPQVPGDAFEVPVSSPDDAVRVMEILDRYDMFQFEHRIKPDYASANGLQERVDDEGHEDPWCDWHHPDDPQVEDPPEDVKEFAKLREELPIPGIGGVSDTRYFTTERLFVIAVLATPSKGFIQRWFFMAIPRRAEDEQGWKIVCTASVSEEAPFAKYLAHVEWIETSDTERRRGYAIELWRGLMDFFKKPVRGDGVTDSGIEFVVSLQKAGMNEHGGVA